MNKSLALIVFATVAALPVGGFAQDAAPAALAATPVSVSAGSMLFAPGGKRLAAINRVQSDGSPQIILDGRLITVPASTLTLDNGKPMTSLSKKELTSR